jgi:hypothetical protein
MTGFGFGDDHAASAAFQGIGLVMAANRANHFGWSTIYCFFWVAIGFPFDESALGACGPELLNKFLILLGIGASFYNQSALGHQFVQAVVGFFG